jgi:hypothetical protein
MGEENQKRLLLLILSLSLKYIFRSSTFPQAHIDMNFKEAHLNLI